MKIELVYICSARFIINLESTKSIKWQYVLGKSNSDLFLFLASDGNCLMYICVEEVRAQKLWMKDGQCYNVCEENLVFSLILCIPILPFFLWPLL